MTLWCQRLQLWSYLVFVQPGYSQGARLIVRICLLFIGRSHVVGCIVALAREESDDGEDMGWSGFILSSMGY